MAQQDNDLPEVWEPQQNYDPCATDGIVPFSYPEAEVETQTLCDQYGNSDLYVTVQGGVSIALPRGLVENEYFFVQGAWTISPGQNLTFRNCYFKMAPGAQIIVACVDNEEMTFDDCKFFACDRMWRGIVVTHQFSSVSITSAPQFNFTNCQIEDAVEALAVGSPAAAGIVRYNIMESHFINNYIGFVAKSTQLRYILLSFKDNHLGTTQNLRPSYSVRAPKYWPLAEAGVVLEGFYAGIPLLSNHFFQTYYGIVATNSVLTVSGGDFKSLWRTGISVKDSRLKVAGGCGFIAEKFLNNQPFMENGIYSEGCDLDISGCTFKKALINGIYGINNNNAQVIKVYGNTFTEIEYASSSSGQVGIWINRSAAVGGGAIGAHNDIFSNTFSITKPPVGQLSQYRAVIVDGVNIASDVLFVRDHSNISLADVAFTNAGIAVLNVFGDNCRILNNQVTMIGQTHNSGNYGIELSTAGQNHEVSNNTIIGSELTNPQDLKYKESWQCGLHISVNNISDISNFCNNAVDQSYHGLHLLGSDGVFNLRENNLFNHGYGIRIEKQSIGHQDGHGNTWNGVYREYAASKDGIGVPINSRFWVPESNQLPYLPPAGQIKPDPRLEPDEDNRWFRYTPEVSTYYCNGLVAAATAGLNAFETALAEGTVELPETEQWEAEVQLYRNLLENPALITSSSVQNFFNAHQQSAVGAFAQMDYLIRQAARYPLSAQMQRENLAALMHQNETLLAQLWETWNHTIGNAGATGLAQWQTISQTISESFALQQTLDAARRAQLEADLAVLQTANEVLAPSTPQQNARKTLNHFWMERLQGIPMSQTDYTALREIAFAPATAVGQMAKQEAANQLAACDRQQVSAELEHFVPAQRSNTDSDVTFAFDIRPNPSSGIVRVGLAPATGQTLRVFDLTGSMVYGVSISGDQNNVLLDLSQQPNGMYVVQLLGGDLQTPRIAKILLQR